MLQRKHKDSVDPNTEQEIKIVKNEVYIDEVYTGNTEETCLSQAEILGSWGQSIQAACL